MIFLGATGAAHAGDATGEWRDEDGKATIRIVDCGSALWGVIASEKSPGHLDTNNPDIAKRNRTTLGMPILIDMKKSKDEEDTWEGKIYDPIRGKLFDSSIVVKSPTELRVEGCIAMVLCGGQTWSRVEPGTSGFTYGPSGGWITTTKTGAPKAAAAPLPTPVGASKSTKGAKGPASNDPAAAEICALPEIASAPPK
jgi:uncharacterized protein (DUF2147 family)